MSVGPLDGLACNRGTRSRLRRPEQRLIGSGETATERQPAILLSARRTKGLAAASLLTPVILARLAGFEPTTPWFVVGWPIDEIPFRINDLRAAPCTTDETLDRS